MKKVQRKVIAVLLVCCMCLAFAGAVANINTASDGGSIAVEGYTFDLNTSTGLARYDASITGIPGVSSVYVATVIQKRVNGSWVNVSGTFDSATANGLYALAGGQWYLSKGYWYRTENTFIAYLNGVQTKHIVHSDMELYN